MSDVTESGEIPVLVTLMPLPGAVLMEPLRFRPPQIHNHGPGEYCYFCPCQDCSMFYGRTVAGTVIQPLELSPPRYGDMGLVNSMRTAAAKREEDRQDKRSAERECFDTAAKVPKKDKASKDQPKKKNLRQNMKRRHL